jgi:Uma2 family endonuclease
MRAPARERMTTDEFLAWAMEQPEGERYELVAGEVVAMAPERLAHTEVKALVWLALRTAIGEAGVGCQALPDGASVEIDEHTTYEPDALVRCGERLPGDTVKLSDPVIVVEVVSPSSRARDVGAKLEDYFRLASVRHYLIVRTDSRSVIHHRRDEAGEIATRILRGGPLELDPPRLMVEVEAFFVWDTDTGFKLGSVSV